MYIFVTGGSGFVGSAVIQELFRAGHQVTGLARSEESAKTLTAAGANAHRGDLEDLDRLRAGAAESDGVIHCGFIHDFTKFKENCEIDRRAIQALGSALAGSSRPLIVTSGMGLQVSGRVATENDVPPPSSVSPRAASEEAARAIAENNGVRAGIVRLAPSVHGIGDHGFVPILINLAREKKLSAYVDDGSNRWCAVHRFDAARLYRLAFEKLANGDGKKEVAIYHGVAESEILFREIAGKIGERLNVPVVSKHGDEAVAHFTWFERFAQMNASASSEKTRAKLDWQPTEIGLLADLDHYAVN